MNQVQINNKTISVKWSVSVENELFVDIYRYGGKIKSVTCADTLIYTADEQGVYRFIAHKEKDGKRYPVSHQIVELFDDETKAKYEMFKTDKISNIIYPLDYYPYIKPFQDIAICINTGKLDYAKDEELRNYYISKYDGKISLISSEKPVEIDGGFVLFSGYMFCNKKLIMGNDEVLAEDCLTTNLEGCYSRVVVYKDEIRLDSDYFNMHTFYYFEQGDTVIICNHYHMLIKLLHMIGDIHLTVRQNYISDIMAGFCGVNEYPFDNFTLFNEIQTISVNDRIEIINGRIERRKSELYNDLNREKPFFSEQLYQKAVKEAAQSIVNTIQIIERDTRIKKVSVDLTGGVDSRCVFAALSRLEDKQKFKYYNGSRYQDKEFTIPVMLADRIGVPFDFARCESNSTEEFRQFVRKKMSLSMHKLIDAHVLLQEYGVDNKKVCLNGGDAGFRGSYINDILFKGYDFIDNFEILRENFKEKDKEFIKIILSKFAICSVEDVEVLNEDFLSALEEFTGSDYEKAEKLYFNRARYHYSPIRDGGYGILQISPLLNRNIVRLFYGTFGRIDTYKVEFDVLFSLNSLLEILLDFAKRDSRVKIVDKENAGYGHTMNLGMDMARGEYIGIIESDDYVDLQMYEDLYRLAKEKRLDWIKADFNRFIVEKNRVINTYNDVAKKKEYYNRVISPAEEPFSFRFIMNTWSGIYNRQFLVLNNIRHQETPGASFQDNGFWFQTMIYAKRIYVVDSPYYMNRRDNPNSSVYDKGKADCIIEEYNYIYDILCRDKGKLQFFAPQYYLKKYHNYLFHYNRIANKDRAVFLEKISKEFRSTIEQEEVEQEIFFSQEWDEFEWIAYDPKDYYAQHNDDSIDVSIIIPVYNAAPYLKKCLDSVLGQTHRNIEVICIDDGSEDESLEILNNYAKKDNRMIVLTQMNGGGGTARNKGLDIAKGEYLLFLDADDFFEEELAEIVYNTCKKRSADVCIYRVKTYDNRTGKVFSDKGSFIKENIPGKDVFAPKDMPEKLFITFQTWPWNKMFRRHFIEKEKIRFQEIKRTNDMFFTYSALMKADRITTVDKELVYYRIGNPNSCQSTNEVAPLDFSKALMKLHDEMETSEKYVVYKESWLNLLVKSCIYNLNKQNEPSVYRYVYDFLHDEFLPPMELTEIRLTDGCLINADDYKECLKIVNQTYDAYMLDKLVWYRNETARLQKRVNFMKGTVSEAFTKEIMVSKDESMKEIIRLKDENTRLQLELVATRTSMSCRIGLALTFLPRKIVKMFRNLLVRNQTIKSLSILL